jgi:hypothetical protein
MYFFTIMWSYDVIVISLETSYKEQLPSVEKEEKDRLKNNNITSLVTFRIEC